MHILYILLTLTHYENAPSPPRPPLIDRAFAFIELSLKLELKREGRRLEMDPAWRPTTPTAGPAPAALNAARQAADDLGSAAPASLLEDIARMAGGGGRGGREGARQGAAEGRPGPAPAAAPPPKPPSSSRIQEISSSTVMRETPGSGGEAVEEEGSLEASVAVGEGSVVVTFSLLGASSIPRFASIRKPTHLFLITTMEIMNKT